MSVQWTKEQQKVIDTTNRNILVSAAAGSGKTAVLVERIIKMVTDSNNPIDIDRLLIVTFTNAAAAEMRERIGEALEKKLATQPDNEHLYRQLSLLSNSYIMTIHSFCLMIIRNYFHIIELDPSFKVGDETELMLLKSDVVKNILENHYQLKDQEFYNLVESYSSNKSDDILEELVVKIYTFAQSYPWPKEWLLEQAENYNINSLDELNKKTWMIELKEYIKTITNEMLQELKYAKELCALDDGPVMYLEQIESDIEQLIQIAKEDEMSNLYKYFSSVSFSALSRKKSDKVEPAIREEAKQIRNENKKRLEDIRDNYFFDEPKNLLNDIKNTYPLIKKLIELVIEFIDEYTASKREKNLVDFNDLEHLALGVLIDRDEEKQIEKPSNIALELQQQFVEILIDEYQDSNLVQEKLLTSVSRVLSGRPNIFMVGDVKQSIYKFRLAKPELFMQKYEQYEVEDSLYQRIDLHKNFRSRKTVLSSVNFIFEQIMSRKVGDVDYNKDVALYEGANYQICKEGMCAGSSELHLIEVKNISEEDLEFDLTEREIEAKVIAKRIKQFFNEDDKYMVFDKHLGGYRQIKYKDIVILLRTMSGWADKFSEILMSEGIPVYSDTSSGYFENIEIKVLISLLKIIDNPRQDIPLLSVLRSQVANFSSEELSIIRSTYPQGDFYHSLKCFKEEMIENELNNKINTFLEKLKKWRDMIPYMHLNELIWKILDETGYYEYVSVMPGGKQRQANIELLIEKALKYESSSYKGLSNFIRMLDKINKYQIDFGEATLFGESENLVRIMSIHKSKGLEFPVVFVSGLGKRFNQNDLREAIVIHPEMGLGAEYVNYELRYKKPTIAKKAIQNKLRIENLSEELRVLYVALTRAKEKLILTGTINARTSLEKRMEKWSKCLRCKDIKLPYTIVSDTNSFLELIVPSLLRHKCAKGLLQVSNNCSEFNHSLYDVDIDFEIITYQLEEILTKEARDIIKTSFDKNNLINWNPELIYDESTRQEINNRLLWKYQYKDEVDLYVKMSVSEIKKQAIQEDDIAEEMFKDERNIKPKFMEDKLKLTSAERGTLMHKVMQYLPLNKLYSYKNIENELLELENKGYINQNNRKAIYVKDILMFAKSSLAKRMCEAEENGLLYKERQFVLGIKASEINNEINSDEIVLIQGVIDCYFEENGELILVDYKTDYVQEGNENILVERYYKQLEYYSKALEQITGKKVKQRLIYSFGLNKVIGV